jgi:hypothetical protein
MVSSEFAVATEDLDRAARAVPPEAALLDLAQAWRIFDEAYAGVDGRPRTPSVAALEGARAHLRKLSRVEPRVFASLLRQLFWQPDGHLAFGWGGRSPLRLLAKTSLDPAISAPVVDRIDGSGAWVRGGRLLGCDEPALLATPEGRYALGVFEPHAATELNCRVEQPNGASLEVTLALHRATRAIDRGGPERGAPSRAVELEPGKVPVLAIRSFDNAAEAELRELPRIARYLRDQPAFIVDLRGNSGGNYAFAEPFLLELTNTEFRRLDEREVLSVTAMEGRANSVRRRMAQGDVPASARAWLSAQLTAFEKIAARLRERGTGRTEVSMLGTTIRGLAPHRLRSRAVFLVDNRCASACEMMLALARQIPGAIVAGQNTRGGMSAGELALFRLRHSGITISLGTRAFHDPLGDFSEARGFLPDLWLDDASDVPPLLRATEVALGSFHPGERSPKPSLATARVDPR